MSERRRLVYSIIQFVQEEIRGEGLSEDAKESLEVPGQCHATPALTSTHLTWPHLASPPITSPHLPSPRLTPQVASQCLQSAYALNTEDKHLGVSRPLPAIFQEATKNEPVPFPSHHF